jgi:hypothetical protein
MAVVFFSFLGGMPISTDEFAYSFQADLMKSFRLYAPMPDNCEFYPCENVVMSNGKWFAKYTTGFPLLLAPGAAVGAPWIVNPVISIFTLVFIFLLTQMLFNRKSAYAAVVIAILSPFFFFNGAAAFQPHISLACALLGATYFYWKSIRERKLIFAFLCGVFFSMAVLIRPVDTGLWTLVFTIITVLELIMGKDRVAMLKSLATISLFGILGIFGVLLVNKIQTGDFTKFSFQVYKGNEVWGFGVFEHNVYKALWNSFYSITRLLSWSIPFMFEAAFIGLFGKEKKNTFYLLFVFLVFIIFYFGWYTIGNYEYGPRYLFSGFVFLIPAAGYGINVLFERVSSRLKNPASAISAFGVVILIYSVAALFPVFFPMLKSQVEQNITKVFAKSLNQLQTESGKKIAVFVVGAPENRIRGLIRNYAPLEKNNAIKILFLELDNNDALLNKKYPDRAAYIAFYRADSKDFIFSPFPDTKNLTVDKRAQYELFAGISYRFGVENSLKAAQTWLDSYELNQDNIAPLINIASMFLEEGKLEESKKYWEMILEKNPSLPLSYTSLGSIYEKWGDRENAMKYYLEFLKLQPDSTLSEKIKDKIHFYQVNGRFPDEKGRK